MVYYNHLHSLLGVVDPSGTYYRRSIVDHSGHRRRHNLLQYKSWCNVLSRTRLRNQRNVWTSAPRCRRNIHDSVLLYVDAYIYGNRGILYHHFLLLNHIMKYFKLIESILVVNKLPFPSIDLMSEWCSTNNRPRITKSFNGKFIFVCIFESRFNWNNRRCLLNTELRVNNAQKIQQIGNFVDKKLKNTLIMLFHEKNLWVFFLLVLRKKIRFEMTKLYLPESPYHTTFYSSS